MKNLNNTELMNVNGGGFSWAIFVGAICSLYAFTIGAIDGFLNPQKCNVTQPKKN